MRRFEHTRYIIPSIFCMFQKKHKEEGRTEGIEEGIEKGKDDLNLLNSILISLGRIDDLKRSVHDREFQQKLLDELLPNRINNQNHRPCRWF